MSGLKQDLLAYAEFLKQSGFLYVEPETIQPSEALAAVDGAKPATHSEAASLRPSGPREVPPRGGERLAKANDAPSKPILRPDTSPERSEPMSKKQRAALEAAAREKVAACTACPLHKNRTQTVYGTGSLQARIVFLGEAPGAEEDRTGVPFVGRAGQLLTKMIESIGFTRDEVYICNTVKCRPPDNRDPTPDEKATCRPFLEEQLKILRPQILVGLGAHAAGYLTGLQTSLGKMRSQWHEFEGVPTMVTYHPAFLLRSPGMKKQAWEDLKMLVTRYNELNPKDVREVWAKEKGEKS